MNNNKICNPKTFVASGMMMNDKDILNDVLSSLKCIVKDLSVAILEASNENLYDLYFNMITSFLKLQREVYYLMFRKGWYVLECVENQKIVQKYNMLNQELTDLDI